MHSFCYNLSIIILAGNEEEIIEKCLKSCRFASEIILVAANSTDKTKTIVKKIATNWKTKVKIIETFDEYNKNFSKWRNLGYKNASKQWILYIDADEIIPFDPELRSFFNINRPQEVV